uniref:Papain-like cysteine proteinase n=1 Tax=Hordeum vulgare subsp. vulgare TaxID=112509 RepID=B4ESF7_HORVV|nr:papain-like cysteine proteinase [Hordeum vulgare subsp. vulgare]
MGMAPLFRSLPLLVLLVALSSTTLPSSRSTSVDGDHHDLLMLGRFHRWMSWHGRTYPSAAEKLRRFEAYRRNVDLIDASNRDAERLGYELGENEFTDLTNEEFMTRYIGGAGAGGGLITTLAGDVVEGVVSSKNTIEGDGNLTMTTSDPPRQFDWREHGAVTPAKQQGACGCCWAFAAAATVESLNKINGGELVDLSVQELVDCSTGVFSSPCGYGWPKSALQWIKSKGGLLTEAEYPYVAKRGRCKVHDAARRIGKITGVQDVQPGSNEDALALAVLRTPVTVQIDGSGSVLQNYKSGVYKGPCTTSQNHVVTVVGYGVTGAGEEYWIAKNSWGQTWGQNGFFFMRRGADGPRGLCGMAMYGAYPVM